MWIAARRTIADGVAVAGPSALTLGLIERYVDEVVTVSEEEIAQRVKEGTLDDVKGIGEALDRHQLSGRKSKAHSGAKGAASPGAASWAPTCRSRCSRARGRRSGACRARNARCC